MKDRQGQKGIILFIVSAFTLIIFIGIAALLYALEANRRNVQAFSERTVAFYLCETGASVAILDIGRGRVPQSGHKVYNWTMGTKTYPVTYVVTKIRGSYRVEASVGPSAGFTRTYTLTLMGRRAFPYFIRGFAGK